MSATLFYVTGQPSKDRLIDALKLGDDPKVKLRIALTIRYHSLDLRTEVGDIEVIGYDRSDRSEDWKGFKWVNLTLLLHKPVQYWKHSYQAGEVKCALELSRRHEGTIFLTEV